jgi:hypothetical protein
LLGDGNYGTVFDAYLKKDDAYFCFGALKQPKEFADDPRVNGIIKAFIIRRQFENEITMAKELRNIHGVVQIIGTIASGDSSDSPLHSGIVYELHGGDVEEVLQNPNDEELGVELQKEERIKRIRFIEENC